MNEIENLAYLTDCIFHEYNGSVTRKFGYHVIRTPTNPGFWFGNCILFKDAPGEDSFGNWLAVHKAEFGDSVAHMTFGWESQSQGITREFEDRGFRLNRDVALRLGAYSPSERRNRAVEIRKIVDEREWRAVTKLQVQVDREDFGFEGDDGVFRQTQEMAYKALSKKGRGDWWGAFLDDELVSSMGLFFDRDRKFGRFQNVATSAQHRSKGICATLLDEVSRYAFEEVEVGELVINTGDSEDNPAKRVYESLGFKDGISGFGLTIPNRSEIIF